MATIINNPGEGGGGSGLAIVVGVLVALALVGLFIVYGLPALRGGGAPAPESGGVDVNVELPAGGSGGEAMP